MWERSQWQAVQDIKKVTHCQTEKKSILHPEIQQHVIAKIKNKETLKSGLQWICINDDITT